VGKIMATPAGTLLNSRLGFEGRPLKSRLQLSSRTTLTDERISSPLSTLNCGRSSPAPSSGHRTTADVPATHKKFHRAIDGGSEEKSNMQIGTNGVDGGLSSCWRPSRPASASLSWRQWGLAVPPHGGEP
jgi:hypothetical protein